MALIWRMVREMELDSRNIIVQCRNSFFSWWDLDEIVLSTKCSRHVNGQGQHIRTPEDIEIHTMPSANGISLRVLSVEASTSSVFKRSGVNLTQKSSTTQVASWGKWTSWTKAILWRINMILTGRLTLCSKALPSVSCNAVTMIAFLWFLHGSWMPLTSWFSSLGHLHQSDRGSLRICALMTFLSAAPIFVNSVVPGKMHLYLHWYL